jgi:LysR family transcriptional regulator of gallate degradation
MEMQQLRHFVAAVEHGNLGKAARALNITQPALSRSIKNLEGVLGAALLERTPRGVAATVFGETLLSHARIILNETERATDEVKALKGLSQGQVSVGITVNFAGYIVPRAVAALLAERPGVNISLCSGFYDELMARLRRGEVDFIFGLFPPVPDEPDLVFEEMMVSHSRVFAHPDHALAKKSRVTLADLAEHSWVVVSHQPAVSRVFRGFFESNGLRSPRHVLRTDSVVFLKAALSETRLLTIIPEHLVQEDVAAGSLARIANEDMIVTSRCGLITRRRGARSPAATALIAHLQALSAEAMSPAPARPAKKKR